MASDHLNADARTENIRALALAAGISPEEASARFSARILLTAEGDDAAATKFVSQLEPILDRTIATETDAQIPGDPIATEIVVGQANPRSAAPQVFVGLSDKGCTISTSRPPNFSSVPGHQLLTMIAACYTAAVVIYRSIGAGIANPPPDELIINYDDIVRDGTVLNQPIPIGEAYLAGAGAIGNGFLWAARHVDVHGTLHVVDDDFVSAGNLQRQVWFTTEDIKLPKAEVLCLKAQHHLLNCRLIPAVCRLQEHPNRNGNWLRRLIVAVDSRRARRELQNELPYEVFDASTTDVREIVLHYNRQPLEFACLGCLYSRDEREVSQDEAIAEHLGVTVADVRTSRIGGDIVDRILTKHPRLKREDIEGLPFDTLYKQLCASQQLQTATGEQVVAPFAFVSILAGAYLLLELAQRVNSGAPPNSNEWRINPWRAPFAAGRYLRMKRPNCECCGREELQRFARRLWTTGRK